MAGAMLAYQRLYDGVLSGGDWETDLPLDNAIVPRLSAKARTTDATLASCVINRDYGAAVTLRLFVLRLPNLEGASKWRIRGANANTMDMLQYDSGWIDCWPEQFLPNVLQPSHTNYTTRKFTNAQIAARRWDVVHVAPNDITARYWRIEVDVGVGATNTYFEFAFLVMAPVYIPRGVTVVDNIAAGAEFGWESTAEVGISLSGVRQVQPRQKRRTRTLLFPDLDREENYTVLYDMLDDLNLDGYVYFVLDPSKPHLLQRTSFLAQVATLTAVQEAAYDTQSIPIKLLEVI